MDKKTPEEIARIIIAKNRKGSYEDWIQNICEELNLFATQQIALKESSSERVYKYLESEKQGQIIRMKSLGILIDCQTFEQAVNAVIFLAGEYKTKVKELSSPNGMRWVRATVKSVEKFCISGKPILLIIRWFVGDSKIRMIKEMTAWQLVDYLKHCPDELEFLDESPSPKPTTEGEAIKVLKELVELKKLKDYLDDVEIEHWPDDWEAKHKDYLIRKPLAWEAARELLKKP